MTPRNRLFSYYFPTLRFKKPEVIYTSDRGSRRSLELDCHGFLPFQHRSRDGILDTLELGLHPLAGIVHRQEEFVIHKDVEPACGPFGRTPILGIERDALGNTAGGEIVAEPSPTRCVTVMDVTGDAGIGALELQLMVCLRLLLTRGDCIQRTGLKGKHFLLLAGE